jgi:hypothetical protein
MDDLEKLPKELQIQIRMSSIILALKNTLIITPELQEIFEKNYEDELKKIDFSKYLEADQ